MNDTYDVSGAQLSEVIGLIYDAASDERLWPQLLEKIAGLSGRLVHPRSGLPGAADPTGGESPAGLQDAHSVALVTGHNARWEAYLLQCLAPHFARSLAAEHGVRAVEMERDLVEQVVDRLPLAVAVVDADAKVYSINRAMLALTRTGGLMGLEGGHLRLADADADAAALRAALQQVLGGQQDHACLRLRGADPQHTSQGLEGALWVSRARSNGPGGRHGARALVLSGGSAGSALPEAGLRAYFGLSPAEAALAQRLAAGDTLDGAAQALGITRNTAKTQIRQVFAKVGVQRQADLLQAIYRSPLWLDMGLEKRRFRPREAASAMPSDHRMLLRDGRRLAWSDTGDPQGWPVLMCHGFIGTRRDCHPDPGHLRALGIRLLIPERPGCGDSDALPQRRVSDWPQDVEQLLAHLGVDRFGVLSWSMGAAYALELARAMPQRVQALYLVSPMAPVRRMADLRHYRGEGAFLTALAFYTPRLVLPALRMAAAGLRKDVDPLIDKELAREPASAVINNPRWRAQRALSLRTAARNGAESAEAEVMCALHTWETGYPCWPFPTTVWHGDADPQVHWHAGQAVAELVPGATFRSVAGAGHFLLFAQWRTLLGAMRGAAESGLSEP